MQKEGEAHIRAMQCAKHIVDAAHQSATQYKSTREALRKARIEEQKAQEKEKERRKKELEAERIREETQKKKEEEKREKQAQKDREKAEKADKEDKEDQQDGAGGGRRRRRGRGQGEMSETDHPVLATRFSGHDVAVVDSIEKFVGKCLEGSAVIWRARRAPFKKILEVHDDFDTKSATASATLLHAGIREFTSEFAKILEKEPTKIKSTSLAPEGTQPCFEALSLEQSATSRLETEMQMDSPTLDLDSATLVLDRELVIEQLQKSIQRLKDSDAGQAKLHQADQELMLFSKLHMIGFQKGCSFSGVMSGLYPHLIYQMDGTRAVSIVSITDVPWCSLSDGCQELSLYSYIIRTCFQIPKHFLQKKHDI